MQLPRIERKSQIQSVLFNSCPAEVRTQIFRAVFHRGFVSSFRERTECHFNCTTSGCTGFCRFASWTSLLTTCQAIYLEVWPLLYVHNKFLVASEYFAEFCRNTLRPSVFFGLKPTTYINELWINILSPSSKEIWDHNLSLMIYKPLIVTWLTELNHHEWHLKTLHLILDVRMSLGLVDSEFNRQLFRAIFAIAKVGSISFTPGDNFYNRFETPLEDEDTNVCLRIMSEVLGDARKEFDSLQGRTTLKGNDEADAAHELAQSTFQRRVQKLLKEQGILLE